MFRNGSRNDDGPLPSAALPLDAVEPPSVEQPAVAFSDGSSSACATRRLCSLDVTFDTSFRAVSVDMFAHQM